MEPVTAALWRWVERGLQGAGPGASASTACSLLPWWVRVSWAEIQNETCRSPYPQNPWLAGGELTPGSFTRMALSPRGHLAVFRNKVLTVTAGSKSS